MYRSKFEATVAAHLNLTSYETDKIKYVVPASVHTYTPDFALGNGVYLETKGRWLGADRRKHILLKQQHPELRIILLFMNSNVTLSKSSKTTYGDWATKHGIEWYDWRTITKDQICMFRNWLKPQKAPSSLKVNSRRKKLKS